MTRRLALLALLAGVLVAVPGPHDHARAAFRRHERPDRVRPLHRRRPARGGLHGQPGLRPDRQPDRRPGDQRHRARLVARRHPGRAPALGPGRRHLGPGGGRRRHGLRAPHRPRLPAGVVARRGLDRLQPRRRRRRRAVDGPRRRQRPGPAHQQRRRGPGGRPGRRTAPGSPSPARAPAAPPASCCWPSAGAASWRSPRPAASTAPPTGRPTASGSPSTGSCPATATASSPSPPTARPSPSAPSAAAPPAFNDVHPAWSPDGTRIAFARGGDQDDGLPFHIHTVTLATGKTAQVTSGRVWT